MNFHSLTINVPRLEMRSIMWIGSNLIASLPSLIESNSYSKIILVGDLGAQTVTQQVCTCLGIPSNCVIELLGGDECKTSERLEKLWLFFASQKLDRKGLIISVGGGALSDLVGLAAGTYMRGIDFIPIATTLLAQVDAGIGGKSGINLAGIKNLVGIIRQPTAIIADVDTLSSLSSRDLRAGFAEIAKHGLIASRAYFDQVTSREYANWSADELSRLIYQSCVIKRDIVEADESETGPRKALNFGHTLGHAIEAFSLKSHSDPISRLNHGESIAIGMHAACYISLKLGILSLDQFDDILLGLRRIGLKIHLPEPIAGEHLLILMALDKKNSRGQSRWTLLQEIGKVVYDQVVPNDTILEAIERIQPE